MYIYKYILRRPAECSLCRALPQPHPQYTCRFVVAGSGRQTRLGGAVWAVDEALRTPFCFLNPMGAVGEVEGRREGKGEGGEVSCSHRRRPLRISLPAGARTDLRTNPLARPSETPQPPRLIPLFHPHRARFGAPRIPPSRPSHSPYELGDLNGGRRSQGSKKKMISFLPTAKKRDRKSYAALGNGYIIQTFPFCSHEY